MSSCKTLLFAAVVLSTGCTHFHSSPVLRLPTLGKAPAGMDTVRLTGRLDGFLQYENLCFKLKSEDHKVLSTILWGESFEAIRDKGSVAIRDKINQRVYRSGMRVMTGGGQVQTLPENLINSDVAVSCGGPFVSVHTMEELK